MAFLSSYLSRERFKRIAPYVEGDVLDIGCQGGQLLWKLPEQITSYIGIDISQSAIVEAKKNHPSCEFKLINLDDDKMDYVNKFDTIVMSAVIEHLFNLKLVGQGLSTALRP